MFVNQFNPMKKILVVDDESDILFLLKSLFSIKGFDVRVTLTCDEGLDIFYSFKPDLVLLDVNVGTSDGRIMCRTIKAQADYLHIPVILISANLQGLLTYADYGADAYVEKPFKLPQLLTKVQSYLNKK
jgi:DNA-binding response OmpR family regulator